MAAGKCDKVQIGMDNIQMNKLDKIPVFGTIIRSIVYIAIV